MRKMELFIINLNQSCVESFVLVATGKLHLERNCNTYNYLNQSGCTKVATIDDKKDFLIVEVCIISFVKCVHYISHLKALSELSMPLT